MYAILFKWDIIHHWKQLACVALYPSVVLYITVNKWHMASYPSKISLKLNGIWHVIQIEHSTSLEANDMCSLVSKWNRMNHLK